MHPHHPDDDPSSAGRFARTFAKRPALPHLPPLRGNPRVWVTTAVAAAAVVAVVLAVPVIGRIGGPSDQPMQAVEPISGVTLGGGLTSPTPTSPSGRPTDTPPVSPPATPGRPPVVQLPGGTVTQTVQVPGRPGANITTTTKVGTGGGGGTVKPGTNQPQKPGADSTTAPPPKVPPKTTTPPQVQNAPRVTSVPVQNFNTNRCVDVKDAQSGTAKDGTALQLWDCANSTNQKWAFSSDGTVRSMGLCMDLAWASTDDGTQIQLVKCNGGWAQRFTLNGSHDLVNPQADKCVTADGTGNGARLVLRSCNGSSSQKWRKL